MGETVVLACSSCGVEKPLTGFAMRSDGKASGKRLGRRSHCTACRSAAHRRWSAKPEVDIPGPDSKPCDRCGVLMPATDRYFKDRGGWLSGGCVWCWKRLRFIERTPEEFKTYSWQF